MLEKSFAAGCNLLFISALLGGCAAGTSVKMKQDVSANVTKKVESKYTGPKRRVGVVDFENKSAYGQSRLGQAASDILITELVKTGKFIVVERDKVNKILEEQKLGLTGAIDSNTAAQMGRILGLNAIITGAISNFGVRTTGSDYLIAQSKRQEATCTVDIRAVDAETGQILLADSGKGVSKVSSGGFLGMGTQGSYAESIEGDSLRAAISQLIENITSQINKKPWSCRVALVSQGKIYLNAGKESGLETGQKLKVFSLGAEIKDPESGIVLGKEEEEIGQLQIASFFGENGSIGKTIRGRSPQKGDLCRLVE
ncbi:MAG: hypothetical protein A2902_01680 [Elusimicrobia bacterium RIFCSPLOWO2_01_FULL_64_13]|nr:MAG: hypothetical protein A2902_01680 [Elusimicrobia bacterium RIFCSPLOWO2_01_FULL_64_13]